MDWVPKISSGTGKKPKNRFQVIWRVNLQFFWHIASLAMRCSIWWFFKFLHFWHALLWKIIKYAKKKEEKLVLTCLVTSLPKPEIQDQVSGTLYVYISITRHREDEKTEDCCCCFEFLFAIDLSSRFVGCCQKICVHTRDLTIFHSEAPCRRHGTHRVS